MDRGLGYLPTPHDGDYHLFSARRPSHLARAVESRFDDLIHGIRNQGNTNSCVGHSVRGAIELRRALDGQQHVDLSALDLYWNARAHDGYEFEDGGSVIRSACRIAYRVGVCSEAAWAFDERRVNTRPSPAADVEGVTRADGAYERIVETGPARVEAVLDALQDRCPVVAGIMVDDLYMNCSGNETIPAPGPGAIIRGGHAVYFCGMDRSGERMLTAGSYGRAFGFHGFVWLASEWIELVSTQDVWVLRPQVEVVHA